MLISLDGFLIFLTAIILLAGLTRRWSAWRAAKQTGEKGNWFALFGYLFLHRSIGRKIWTGIAHYILMWGTVLFLLVVLLDQFNVRFPEYSAALISVFLDVLGVLMLLATLFFLLKKLLVKREKRDYESTWTKTIPLVLFLFIIITGFLAEGFRLSITNSGFETKAPVGSVISSLLFDSPELMQLMIRLHLYGVLLMMISMPFTFLRHIPTGVLNVFNLKPAGKTALPRLAAISSLQETDQVEAIAGTDLLRVEACVDCRRCDEVCPAFIAGKPLSPASVMQQAALVMDHSAPNIPTTQSLAEQFPSAAIWSCTACLACIEHCPIKSRPADIVALIRRNYTLADAKVPKEAVPMLRNLETWGDPMGKGLARRTDWAFNQGVETFSQNDASVEYLLWVGCFGSFHPGSQETTRALTYILQKAKVSFKILGSQEYCCGEPARKLGEEILFREIADKNIQQLSRVQFKQIMTLCPHCYNTLKNDYPTLGANYSVKHATEVVSELLAAQRISFKYSSREKNLVIHDPCYLGRANRVYQPLRELAKNLPGCQLMELPRNKESSFCCGAGGGGMWLHEESGQSINSIRSREIDASPATLVATACPYCMTMLEDGLKSLEKEKIPKVKDIIELVAESLG